LTHYWDCVPSACAVNNPGEVWETTSGPFTFNSQKSFTKVCEQDTATELLFDQMTIDNEWSSSVDASLWTTKQVGTTEDGDAIWAYPTGLGNKNWCPAPIGVFKDMNLDFMPLEGNQIVREDPPEYAYQCQDMNPWREDDGTWYGYVAVGGFVKPGNCGRCVEVTGLRGGGKLIAQVINIGDGTEGNLDLLVAGGGVGAYPKACSAVWKGDLFDYNNGQCTNGGGDRCIQYGGFTNAGECNTQFEQVSPDQWSTQQAQDACNEVLFGEWFAERGNPEIEYRDVDCTTNLICRSQMYPVEWSLADIEANCGEGDVVPTTQAPTTQAPTTEAPRPTTEAPTTQAPTTEAPRPTTEAPTTQRPTTEAPTTQAPTTQRPTTEAPTTQAPTTQAPTTQAPTTQAPTTQAPTTESSGVAQLYDQCGGQGWSGPTTCVAFADCQRQNQWYSQCVPGEIPPEAGVAGLWEKCGGQGHTGPTECAQGGTCVRQSQYYSQCRPSRRLSVFV
jgi:hypothetical protein